MTKIDAIGHIENTTAEVLETSEQILPINSTTAEAWFTASFSQKYHATAAGSFDAELTWTLDANDEGDGREVTYATKVEGWTVADCNNTTKEAIFKRSFTCNQAAATADLVSVNVPHLVICKGYWNT